MILNNKQDKINKTTIAILCGLIPTYRKGFYDNIFKNENYEITVYCQEKLKNYNLKSIHNLYPQNIKTVKSLSFKREILNIQILPFFKILFNYDIIIVEGNPRNLSHFFVSSIAKIFKKKVILWTMVHSHNSNLYTENLRLVWTKFFKYLFVYTEAEISLLREKGFEKHTIFSMNNGLDQTNIDYYKLSWDELTLKNWQKANHIQDRFCLISSARLDRKNNFHFVLLALKRVVDINPEILWILIGDGEEKEALINLAKQNNVEKNILFLGEIYNEKELCPWFLSSQIFIHPGSIGLSLMHAFGYELPVLTHSNQKKHGPEFAIFENEKNGFVFIENDFEDFLNSISYAITQKSRLKEMGNNGYKIVSCSYNTENMSKSFFSICDIIFKNQR